MWSQQVAGLAQTTEMNHALGNHVATPTAARTCAEPSRVVNSIAVVCITVTAIVPTARYCYRTRV
jgi:hypothetical protein